MEEFSDSRAKHFAENAPLPVHSLDAKGIIIWVNSQWTDLFGYRKDEVVGKAFADFLTPESKSLAYNLFEHLMRTGSLKNADLKVVLKDGTELDVNVNSKLMHDHENQSLYTYCILTDMSKRKQMETELMESEERYRKLFEYSIEGIVITRG
ncbi:PAS domain-containing protein, partial [Nitrospirota bacterium]